MRRLAYAFSGIIADLGNQLVLQRTDVSGGVETWKKCTLCILTVP